MQSDKLMQEVQVERATYAPDNFFKWTAGLDTKVEANLVHGNVESGASIQETWDDYTELINILSTPVDDDQIVLSLEIDSPDFVTLDTTKYEDWDAFWDTNPKFAFGGKTDAEWIDSIRTLEVAPCQMLTFNVTSPENFEKNWNVYQSFGFHDAAFRDAQPVFTDENLADALNVDIQQMWSGMASFRVPCDSVRGEEMPYNEYVRKFEPADFGVSRLWIRADWNVFAGVWTREAKFDFKIKGESILPEDSNLLLIILGLLAVAGDRKSVV